MNIEVGKTAGFCGGVTNSVEKTKKILEENASYCLGELVHNKQVIESLETKGLKTIETLDEVEDNSTVIVRAHGIEKEIYEKAKNRGIKLIDLTCPKVLKIHEKIEEYVDKGYFVILVGGKKHPETIGSYSFCKSNGTVLEKIDEVEDIVELINKNNIKNVVVFSQTTYSVRGFDEIVGKLKDLINVNLEIVNTICLATSKRQEETASMAKEKDCMIIIGGKNSSNTKKLYEVASTYCKNCFLIETADDLEIDSISNFKNIGVMAGASTPKESIDEVVELLKGVN